MPAWIDKPIFIVGLPRSGSTLWHNIIATDPCILRIAEMHFLNPWRKDFRYFCRKYVGDRYIDDNIRKMVELFFSDQTIGGLTGQFWRADINDFNESKFKEHLYQKVIKSERSLGSIFQILIREITGSSRAEQCCIKFPVYPSYIPQLIRWFPECKIVHITRDPRATAVSRTNDPGGTRNRISRYPNYRIMIKKVMIYFVAIQYVWTSFIHYRHKQNKNYALFRFEDLLTDPEKIVRQLCQFIERDFKAEMLNPKIGQESSITKKKANGFDQQAGSRWVNVISQVDRCMITLLTRNSMRRLGYDPDNHPILKRFANSC